MSDINPKNPAVLEAMADVDTKRMLLSIAESVTYERIIERGVTYTEQDLRIHSLNYSFKLNEFSAQALRMSSPFNAGYWLAAA